VLWRDSVPDMGAPLPALQQVARSPERTLDGSVDGDGLVRGQMATCADH